ncbi:DNA pilot protein [robinz microvirus RP_143]|nr:DNA pilot protein [robinz microvirus RP_143]
MDPLLGLVGSIGGGLINNLFAGARQDEAQDFSREQQYQSYLYARGMRATAYQDTMQDMQKAGLNPILAYQRGATGATTIGPSSPSSAPVHDVGIGAGVNSALAIRQANQQLELLKEQTASQRETTQNIAANTLKTTLQQPQVVSETAQTVAQTDITRTMLEKANKEMVEAKSITDFAKSNPAAFNLLVQAGYIGNTANTALSPVWSGIGAATKIPFMSSGKSVYDDTQKGFKPASNFNAFTGRKFEPAPPHPGKGWFSDRFRGQ